MKYVDNNSIILWTTLFCVGLAYIILGTYVIDSVVSALLLGVGTIFMILSTLFTWLEPLEDYNNDRIRKQHEDIARNDLWRPEPT